jgi:CheY-like chemotaxis protein
LVDDNQALRELLVESLQHSGYEVESAADGCAALKIYRQSSFDLVITDLVMPEKEGLETIIDLRKIQPKIKILAISGTAYLPLAGKLGATQLLSKPFTVSQILERIKTLLDE